MKFNTKALLRSAILLICCLIALLLCNSCNRYTLYQQDAKTGAAAPPSETPEKELTPGDKISVSIWGHDELSIGSVHSVHIAPDETAGGKWLMVDLEGKVNLPQIGKVKVEGLTVRKAEELLVKLYSAQLQNPIINVRLLNNQVTVLGEVRQPGTYIFHTDYARMVDMIGKAGGFTDYAKTTDIKIIRGTETIEVNLTRTTFNEMTVLPRDVIYITPSRGKAFDRLAGKLIPFASLLTALALVYNVSKN